MSNNYNRILALGDSLTEGYIDDEISWYGGKFYPYTRALASMLKIPVDNHGVSGENTKEILTRLQNIKRKYKYAIILAGTNDLEQKLDVKATITNIIDMHLYCHLQLGVEKTYCLSVPEIIIDSKKWKESDRKFINKSFWNSRRNTITSFTFHLRKRLPRTTRMIETTGFLATGGICRTWDTTKWPNGATYIKRNKMKKN